MGRSAPAPDAAERLARLELDGAVVRVIRGDVARDEDVPSGPRRHRRYAAPGARCHPRRRRPRRRGAGAPEPARRWPPCFAPKVAGAWNLHVRCASLPLDFFVRLLVDRLGARLAGPGELRRGQRLPRRAGRAASGRGAARRSRVSWGPWSEAGMAATLGERDRRRWATQGVRPMAPAEALGGLGRALDDRCRSRGGRRHRLGSLRHGSRGRRYAARWAASDGASTCGRRRRRRRRSGRSCCVVSTVSRRRGRRAAVLAHVGEQVIRVLGSWRRTRRSTPSADSRTSASTR